VGVTAEALVVRRGRFVLNVPAFAADASGTVVLGRNGAGKTTLLLALQGLLPADGTVTRPARTAAVFARPAVLRGSALWNVATVAGATRRLANADAQARAADALRDVGLLGAAHADARTLSTGERQRLALARALVTEPDALFLDEPFANVDADARPGLRALVRAYVARSGAALALATSSLADALALCRDAVVLEHGNVVHRGSTTALRFASDAYVEALLAESRGTIAER
jgi:tungstate transport system ATP-binding protein